MLKLGVTENADMLAECAACITEMHACSASISEEMAETAEKFSITGMKCHGV
jgi:hypothetical protein